MLQFKSLPFQIKASTYHLTFHIKTSSKGRPFPGQATAKGSSPEQDPCHHFYAPQEGSASLNILVSQ